MKMFDIAFKDLLRSFRSKFALVMMFAAPLMITGLIYFAFSGLASDEGGFELPVTYVQVVNLDQPDLRSGLEIGQILIESMRSEELADLLQVTQVASEAVARAAVDAQLAAVAVIIPPNFTAAVISAEGSATITLYPDPTLTLGPAVVQTMLSQVVDSFAGTKIAIKVTGDQLNKRGLPLGEEMMAQVALQYTDWLQSQGQQQSGGAYPGLDVQPSPGKAEPVNQRAAIVGPIMAGMLIFFAFFTGASTAQSILREDEGKTLPRLFTTPTRRDVILGGHFTAVFITLVVQTVVLLIASSLIFGVRWGEPLAVALVAVGLVVASAGFGVLLVSFCESTRQAGSVMGGVLTLAGMAGGLFTTGIALPSAFETVTLFTPHGWALRGLKLALAGAGAGDVLLPFAVTLGMGIVFFIIGASVFRRRFA